MSEEELENLLSVVIEDTTIASERLRQYIKDLRTELSNLKEIEKTHKEENGKLRVELEEEKEKNKELQKYEEAYKLLSYGLNNYISKDRVKAEMEDIIDYFEYANATSEDIEFLEKKKKEILEEK